MMMKMIMVISFWIIQLTPSSKKWRTKESNITSNSNYVSPELHSIIIRSHVPSIEDVYETPIESLETLVKQSLQMFKQSLQVREELHN